MSEQKEVLRKEEFEQPDHAFEYVAFMMYCGAMLNDGITPLYWLANSEEMRNHFRGVALQTISTWRELEEMKAEERKKDPTVLRRSDDK